jgi:hypothetical protein
MEIKNVVIIAVSQDGTVKLCRRVIQVPPWACNIVAEFVTAITRDIARNAVNVAWYDTAMVNAHGMPTQVYQAR